MNEGHRAPPPVSSAAIASSLRGDVGRSWEVVRGRARSCEVTADRVGDHLGGHRELLCEAKLDGALEPHRTCLRARPARMEDVGADGHAARHRHRAEAVPAQCERSMRALGTARAQLWCRGDALVGCRSGHRHRGGDSQARDGQQSEGQSEGHPWQSEGNQRGNQRAILGNLRGAVVTLSAGRS